MNLNTKDAIQRSFNRHFLNETTGEDIHHDAKILMYRFLSEVERLLDERNINRKELAESIGTSASYITQLFRGNKMLNLETVAKFQKVFDIKFDIKAYPKDALIKDKIIYTTIIQLNSADSFYDYNYYPDLGNPIYFFEDDNIKSTSFSFSID